MQLVSYVTKYKKACKPVPKLILSDFLPYRLSVLTNTISRNIAAIYDREFGLSIWQWRVMAVVGETPGASATQVMQRTAMDKVAVSRAVSGLIELGYMTREASVEDARRSVLALTAQGEGIYDQIVPLALSYERELLSGFDPQELAELQSVLSRLATMASPDRDLW